MPLVEVKINEGRLNSETETRLLEALTDAVVSVCGESVREQTWVVIEGVAPRHWAVGGRALPVVGA